MYLRVEKEKMSKFICFIEQCSTNIVKLTMFTWDLSIPSLVFLLFLNLSILHRDFQFRQASSSTRALPTSLFMVVTQRRRFVMSFEAHGRKKANLKIKKPKLTFSSHDMSPDENDDDTLRFY